MVTISSYHLVFRFTALSIPTAVRLFTSLSVSLVVQRLPYRNTFLWRWRYTGSQCSFVQIWAKRSCLWPNASAALGSGLRNNRYCRRSTISSAPAFIISVSSHGGSSLEEAAQSLSGECL